MLYLFPYYHHLILGIIPSKKGKSPIDYYHQGKDFLYFNMSFNLTRAYFSVGEKNIILK